MVAVGELLASVVLKEVFNKLNKVTLDGAWKEIALQLNFSKDLESIKDKLSFIQSFLEDAERQSSKLGSVRYTLKKLKAAAYDLEDMLLLFESFTTTHKGEGLALDAKAKEALRLCFQRLKMPHKVKTMRKRIEEIIDHQKKFNFIEHPSMDDKEVIRKRETFSDADEVPVGRTEEKERIIRMLQTNDSNCHIVFIYGFGGVGKTTLAQMVFNDDRTKQFFEIQAWVYVSVKFDIMTIGQSIISELGKSSGPAVTTLQAIRHHLRTIVEGQRFLIVLDDLWEEDPVVLETLRTLLRGGKAGSKIIATTRSEKLANLMNESSGEKLGALPDNYCWELFRAKAFPDGVELDAFKERIGRQIVEKCRGIPLAANSLGCLCRTTNEWTAILDSDIWAEDGDDGRLLKDTKVLPSLKLSYQYMPSHLKPCFAYCAVFPKGCHIEKSSLIQQWIALGFVQLPDQSFTAQQAGERYFEELREMSFLQDVAGMSPTSFARYSKHRGVLFQMHDLVRELARLVAGDEVIAFDTNRQQNPPTDIDNCRFMLLSNLCDSSPSDWSIPSTARALHFKECSIVQNTLESLMGAQFLRVLDLGACTISDLPASIGNLRLLKFLNISGMQTGLLPKSLSLLHGLQYLDIHGCSNLKELPEEFGGLANMIHLNMSFCHQLKELPSELFKRMKKLLVLNLSGCVSLEGLPEFCNTNAGCQMLEILDLSDCTNLAALPDTCTSLSGLRCLNLSGCSRIKNFVNLIPHWKLVNLEYLNLSGVGAKAYSEAPGTSAGNAESSDHNKELELGMLQEDIITQRHLVHLRYLSVGGFTLFSEQGIASLEDLLTLPNFDVRTQPSDNHSNIMLLQQILDLTQHELNIKCLENVVSPEEAAQVELARKQQLHFLSLEWSSSDTGSSVEHEHRAKANAVLEHLWPHQNLQCLSIKGYNGNTFPSWINRINITLPNLVKIVLSELNGCDHIPSLGNLLNLQELEINNMPLLRHVQIGSCKKLRRLTLVKLQPNATVHMFDDDNTQAQVNEVGLIHTRDEEEIETGKEIDKLPPCLPVNKQVKRKVKGFLKALWHGMLRETKRTQDIGSGNDSLAVTSRPALSSGPSNEERREQPAVPVLDYLKIESCKQLKLFPYVPLCKEYFIMDSSPSPGQDAHGMLHWTPTFKSKICINRCFIDDVEQWMEVTENNMDELIIIGMLDYSDEKMGFSRRRYWYEQEFRSRTCKKESGSGTLRKLKITDCKSSLIPRLLLLFTSLQELELDGLNTIDNDLESTLYKMTRLEKLTIPFLELPPEAETNNIIQKLSVHHIPYVNTREAIYLADFHLLHQNSDFGIITELCLTNLQLVKKASEVDPGELGRFDQLCRLSLRWSRQPDDQADTGDSAVLQRLQPHPNLSALEIRGYQGATFCAWISNANLYVPNLVKIKLVDILACEHLPSLGQLANLEELHISNMHNIQEVATSFYGGKHPFRKLRKLHIDGMGNLEVWSTNLEPSAGQMSWNDCEQQLLGDEIFPSLEHLIVKGCPRLTLDSGFQGHIKRIIGSCSEIELSARIFIGSSDPSRIEVETNILSLSDGSELLQYSNNLSNLTIRSNSDLITLPGIIQKCRTLRSLQILDCWNFTVLPDWLEDLTSLEEVEVHAPKLQCLPHAIKGLTSLNTLTLKQCNYKLREQCSISGEDYDKIERIEHHVQDLEVSISSSSDIALLEKTTSHQLIELNIKDLQHLSSSEAEKINLVGKEELVLLSLEWSSQCAMINNVALEKLQPHQNLRRFCIKNYPIDAGFPHWMQLLPNLVSMELFNVKTGHLHLDHLQNLEDLHVSSFSSLDDGKRLGVLAIEERYDRSSLRISSMQQLKRLRRVTLARVGKLVWETSTSPCRANFSQKKKRRANSNSWESSCQPSENIFPGLEHLEIDCCLDVTFQPSIPRSARYIISGIKQYPFLFKWPSFEQVMGPPTSASSSKMEIKHSKSISSGPLDSLGQLDIEELTVDSCIDHIPLPECIRGWKSLQKIEILNCEDIKELPDWLGDMPSLCELKVETYWMQTLPPCIEKLTSLQTLALLKCTKRFKQRCSEGGHDWSKIKHIDNLIVEERKR